mgnify:CR=1 FL=1
MLYQPFLILAHFEKIVFLFDILRLFPMLRTFFIDNLFFKSTYYDLSGVGRMKINQRLGINSDIGLRILRK